MAVLAAVQHAATLPKMTVAVPYAAFLALASLVACAVSLESTVFLTLGGMAQGLAIMLLWSCSSASCLASYSAQSLALVVVSLVLRLSSTLWLNGYLPTDSSGDGLYQAVDVCTLVAAAGLLRKVARGRGHGGLAGSAHKEQQGWSADGASRMMTCGILVAILLAALLHGDMNARPVFDTLWLAGHFIGAAASFPQLWLSISRAQVASAAHGDRVTRDGGTADAVGAEGEGETCASHFVSAMAMSQLFTVTYMWLAREDITCTPWVEGFNHTIWAILAPSALHLALVSDAMPQLPSF
mmetsp:Transcript_56603/g.143265  ORF Transcript_56603/g.143265 Transcript_56603/m.143265 type:complete len:297 (+) Transcript_56603:77-967(+)